MRHLEPGQEKALADKSPAAWGLYLAMKYARTRGDLEKVKGAVPEDLRTVIREAYES